MSLENSRRRPLARAPMMLALLLLVSACAAGNDPAANVKVPGYALHPALVASAVAKAKEMNAKGRKVWCVPFARNASGIDIRGDARTWWRQARAELGFGRSKAPIEGSVMAFRATHRIPLGHVAVVAKVVSNREILVDQANWHPSQVSLEMPVIDVSKNNDWSRVRVQSNPNAFGSVYPVDGFIFRKAQADTSSSPAVTRGNNDPARD